MEVWYAEVTKWFPSLKIMRWYESPEKQRTAHIRDDTLGTKLADCLQFLDEKCAVDNPRSEFTIIVSSYETFQGRAIELTPTPGKQSMYADFSLPPPSVKLITDLYNSHRILDRRSRHT